MTGRREPTRLGRWWFAPAPAERLAALRLLIGGYALLYVVIRWGEFAALAQLPASQWKGVGVTLVAGPPALAMVVTSATAVLLVAFVAGWRYRVTGPLAAVAFLWTMSYRNSWGMIFHTENLHVLHVLVLACAPAADAWSLDARRPRPDVPAGHGWPIKLMLALTAATYVLAGVAKLRIAGLDWLDGEQLRNQIAIDNLRKLLLGDRVAPLAHLVLERPAVLTGFCVLTLVLEFAAPVVLVAPRLGRWWAAGAWGFHVGVVLLMNIWFPYPLTGLAFAPLLPVERGLRGMSAVARRYIRRR